MPDRNLPIRPITFTAVHFPLFIARRFLTRQRGTFSSFIVRLAILATGVGVAVMILALAFITGFRHTIRDKLFSFWGEVLVVNYDPYAAEIIMCGIVLGFG